MASTSQRDSAAVRVIPPLVPLLAILLGVGLNHVWPIDSSFEFLASARYWVGGLIVAASFLGLGVWSVVVMRRSGQRENPWKPTLSIVRRGPFRITRNPMYLQMVLVCIGFAVMFMNVWILVLTPVCGWILHQFAVLPEEAYLERKFGEDYLIYKRQVRRWI